MALPAILWRHVSFCIRGKLIHILDLCVRHDVAVLDVGTTVLAASRSLSLKEIAMRPKETSVVNYGKEPKLKISRG